MLNLEEHDVFKDVMVFNLPTFKDQRGNFREVFDNKWLKDKTFVKDNVSYSEKGVVRGLHFQNPHPQGKLVTVISGNIKDYFVDLRKLSPTFGMMGIYYLDPGDAIFVPEGFAHGFEALQDSYVLYKCTDYYYPEYEQTLNIFDENISVDKHNPDYNISMPVNMNRKDLQGRNLDSFHENELF